MHWAKYLLNKINILIWIIFTFNNPQKPHLQRFKRKNLFRVHEYHPKEAVCRECKRPLGLTYSAV